MALLTKVVEILNYVHLLRFQNNFSTRLFSKMLKTTHLQRPQKLMLAMLNGKPSTHAFGKEGYPVRINQQ